MSNIVLDASALLAYINEEIGHHQVEKHIAHAIMSTVNLSEVIVVLIQHGLSISDISTRLHSSISVIADFNYEQALLAASLQKETKQYGLSLGDRACLALAIQKKLPVLTADKIWGKLDIGIEIKIIR